jgi:trigger factor
MATARLISREKNIARVAVELSQSEVTEHYRHMYRENAKDLRIPGFRKGHIPPNVIRQRLGAEPIQAHMSALLKDAALDVASAQLELIPRQGELDWHLAPDPQEGQPLAYEVSIPVLPEVKLPDFSAWEIKVPRLQVTDEMQQRYRQRLRERFINYTPKEGASAAGDAVEISFGSKYADSGEGAPFGYEGMLYRIGEEGNLPGWDDRLLGRSAGDKLEFECKLPENFADARLGGRDVTIDLTIDAVQTVEIPELDETFLRERLRMDSPEQFDSFVTDTLERETQAQHEQLKRELALSRCIQELEADITNDMVDSEIDGLVSENERILLRNGTTLAQYLEQKGQSMADYRAGLREAALRRIRLFLTVQAIATERDLSVGSEDMRRYAMSLMMREGLSQEQMSELLQSRAFMNDATFDILRDKAVGYIVSQAKFEAEDAEVGLPLAAETADQPTAAG